MSFSDSSPAPHVNDDELAGSLKGFLMKQDPLRE